MNGHSGNGAGRKKGDWVAIARGRANRERTLRTSRGLTNVPSLQDSGSAAYRRREAKQSRRPGRAAA